MARQHVIVGSGPGALAAAETIRSLDAAAGIAVVSEDPHRYYSRPGLAYYVANEVTETALHPFSADDMALIRVDEVNGSATGIDRAGHRLVLASGRALPYDRLLIATGSKAIPVTVPGADLDGVVKLDDMADARNLVRQSRAAKVAVVVGGGITALEVVEGLLAHRVHVHYLMRKDRYWGNLLSQTESREVEDGLRAVGVEIHHNAELASILGENGHVAGAGLRGGTRIPCDIVGVAIGVRPEIGLAKAAGLECDRGILADEFLRSSGPDIYVAGDVAEVLDPGSGRRVVEILWNVAVAKGRVAGHNMAAEPTLAYDRGVALNVTRLAGAKITIIGTVGVGQDADLEGLSRGDSDTWRQAGAAAVVEAVCDDARVRLVLGESTIAGAVVMGDQALSFPLQELISARADVGAIRDELQKPGAPVAELVTAHWQAWKASDV